MTAFIIGFLLQIKGLIKKFTYHQIQLINYERPCRPILYPRLFLTGTFLMTDAQVGKYIRLLCLQQQNGGLTEKEMLKVCGEKDEEIWAKFEFENGHYFNKRMLIETKKRKEFIESRLRNLSHMESYGNMQ